MSLEERTVNVKEAINVCACLLAFNDNYKRKKKTPVMFDNVPVNSTFT